MGGRESEKFLPYRLFMITRLWFYPSKCPTDRKSYIVLEIPLLLPSWSRDKSLGQLQTQTFDCLGKASSWKLYPGICNFNLWILSFRNTRWTRRKTFLGRISSWRKTFYIISSIVFHSPEQNKLFTFFRHHWWVFTLESVFVDWVERKVLEENKER